MDKRKPEFDCIRALCMVWIVAVWHMAYYVPQISFVENSMMARKITNGVLATFMFCSGMFCGREGINNLQEVKNFYIKRFIRIYPLFFVSCVSMLILGSFSRRTFIFTVSGLAYITGERPLTIWFLSMLIFFYVLAPVIIYKKNKYRVFTKCVLILGLYKIIEHCGVDIDDRLWILFIFYCLGIIFGDYAIHLRGDIRALLLSLAFFVLLAYMKENIITDFLVVFTFVILIIEFGKVCSSKGALFARGGRVSYLSMNAYLFHRQIYGVWTAAFGKMNIMEAYLIMLPVMMVISYLIQLIYDRLVLHFKNRLSA